MPTAAAPPKGKAAASADAKVRGYFADTRNLATGYLFVLPLLVLYEVGIQTSNSDRVNAVGDGFQYLAEKVGHNVLNVVLACGFIVAFLYNRSTQGRTNVVHIAPLILEAATYAFLIGIFAWAFGRMPVNSLADMAGKVSWDRELGINLLLSLGAGVYEETLFRLVLIGALLWLAREALKHSEPDEHTPYLVAVFTGAVLFALAHHVAFGDGGGLRLLPIDARPFVFRAVCGVFFGALYLMRGFAAAVYAHALYDVLVCVHNASLAR
ncbi:MAG: CPBP family intramembrane metalloprotease [Planctomycetes bacterium]|nr:CPBP family intramembrane metalloprotease [Planctomycetota bacterium]